MTKFWSYSYEPESKPQSIVWVFQNEFKPKPTKSTTGTNCRMEKVLCKLLWAYAKRQTPGKKSTCFFVSFSQQSSTFVVCITDISGSKDHDEEIRLILMTILSLKATVVYIAEQILQDIVYIAGSRQLLKWASYPGKEPSQAAAAFFVRIWEESGDDRAAAGSPAFFRCPGACILSAAIGVQKDENQMPNGMDDRCSGALNDVVRGLSSKLQILISHLILLRRVQGKRVGSAPFLNTILLH